MMEQKDPKSKTTKKPEKSSVTDRFAPEEEELSNEELSKVAAAGQDEPDDPTGNK